MKRSGKLRGNLLSPSQQVVNTAFLLLIFLIMAVPMWNVIVISTSSTVDASSAGLKL